MNINPVNYANSSSPSPFPFLGGDPMITTGDHDDHHQLHHQLFVPNTFQSSSSTSLTCHMFFSSPQDQSHEYYQHTLMHQLPEQQHQEDEIINRTGSYDLEKKEGKSLKLTLWKNEKQPEEENPAKWMSSKMRLMQKMKNSVGSSSTTTVMNHVHEDQKKLQGSSSFESDHFSSNASSSTHNGNPTVRVCADCNTTKTPLWRSGPKGPKSLCNACGIRQRKARRAMAAAAATTNGESETATLKIKVQSKEKIIKSNNNGSQAPQFKKRCSNKITTPESSHHHLHLHHAEKKMKKKKNVFEDFLLSLSENLSFHRVFPQDEKEAAILLMALSCGLVHG